jgi:uncharacterized membrane protein (UPF0127 family)
VRRWLGVVVIVAACAGGGTEGGSTAETSSSTTVAASVASVTGSGPDQVVPTGYDLVQATVTSGDGTECELCLWLADTAEQRRAGLMFVTDLGAGDGMAFRYPSPHSGTFWMKNTLLPLSIAFFAPDGAFVDAFDMEPCTTDDCPNYRTPADFLVAIETTQGDLDRLGIGPGSTLALTDLPCP